MRNRPVPAEGCVKASLTLSRWDRVPTAEESPSPLTPYASSRSSGFILGNVIGVCVKEPEGRLEYLLEKEAADYLYVRVNSCLDHRHHPVYSWPFSFQLIPF